MIQNILKMLFGGGNVVYAFAWAAAIPALVSLAQTAYGAISEGGKRRQMEAEQAKWAAENEAWYNKNYYGDYMQRADVQNVIRKMREEMQQQNRADQNSQAVLGTTNEVSVANKDRRNRAIAALYGDLSAQGQRWKDNIDQQYRARKAGIQGLQYDVMGQQAQSANNLLYNGIHGIANTDWASMLSNSPSATNNAKGSGYVSPDWNTVKGKNADVTGTIGTQGNSSLNPNWFTGKPKPYGQ